MLRLGGVGIVVRYDSGWEVRLSFGLCRSCSTFHFSLVEVLGLASREEGVVV